MSAQHNIDTGSIEVLTLLSTIVHCMHLHVVFVCSPKVEMAQLETDCFETRLPVLQ